MPPADRTVSLPALDDVQAVIAGFAGELPSTAELSALTESHGVELATRALYGAIVQSPRHGPFIERVEQQPATPTPLDARVKILILPAFFYQQFPDSGGDGEVVREVAAACGLTTELVRTESVGSVSANAKILARVLEEEASEQLFVVSLSKGGAELRRCLDEHASPRAVSKLVGWLNVCGLVNGCHFVDVMTSSLSRRMGVRVMARAFGMEYDGLLELCTADPRWATPTRYPARMRVVNVISVPIREHLQRVLAGRYRRLSGLGPNDGMVLLREAIVLPGAIYPIWGGDHFLRAERARPILYRLFRELFSPGSA